ncbi:MAG TPA: aspartate--tRNA ligase [Candidatus Eisenbacteria bacterium]|nr:aspartate--tRNA ligase [Candidatus Eisenbacteria bacterium]
MSLTQRVRCGLLRAADAGRPADLYGWVHRRRDHGGLIFIDLRDRSGLVQVQFHPDRAEAFTRAGDLRLEFVVHVHGTVRRRPPGAENPTLPTGEIEVEAEALEILSRSKTPPFPVNERTEADESLRLRYRYLDLRRMEMTRNLDLRHRMVKAIRDFLDREGFLEIETPVLIRSTPEGARDYLVPSRVNLGRFYALPQSPQLYKQILMVAGYDRYFQIARCYRDEDLRADRQNEFTQLDLEMSFVTEDDVLDVTERCFASVWQTVLGRAVAVPFRRVTHADALLRYGVDKPDLRYGLELVDLTPHFQSTGFQVFRQTLAEGGAIRGLRVPGGAALGRKEIDALTEVAKTAKAKGLAFWYREAPEWRSPITKFFTAEELGALEGATGARPGDLVLAVADQPRVAAGAMGAIRKAVAERQGLIPPDAFEFAWITEFPMYARNEETGQIEAEHHPFTAPHPADVDLIETDPLRVRARSYDLVLNGTELASGSIRIHDPGLQQRIFAQLGWTKEEAARRFGFLLEAFEYGAPPHGGIAPGIDRAVMLAAGEQTIRDVIAFPKNQQAQEPMTGAPATVDAAQLRELGLELRARPERGA